MKAEVGEGVRARESGESVKCCLQQDRASLNPSIGRVEISRPQHLQRSWWQWILTGNGFLFVCLFTEDVATVDYHATVDSAIPMQIRQQYQDLLGYQKKKKKEDGFGKGYVVGYEMRLRGKWRIVLIIFHCIHV